MRLLIFILSISFCYAQSNPTLTVSDFTTNKQVKISVRKSEVKGPPVLNIGPSPYGAEVTTLWTEDDTTYFTYITLIYINYQSDTVKFLAKNFLETGGTIADTGVNSGNLGVVVQTSDVVGFYNVGDWLKYSVNLTGKKQIKFRYSYGGTGTDRKLEIRIGSITGTLISEMTAQPTTNWNTWIDKTIPINVDTSSIGIQDIFFVITGPAGSTNFWGNLTGLITIY